MRFAQSGNLEENAPPSATPSPLFALKILALADLHFDRHWYEWVKRAAPAHHLVAIAGDLLNGRAEEGLVEQMLWVRDWVSEFPSNLAICSGNHDANDQNLELEPRVLLDLPPARRDIALSMLMSGRWMDTLESPRVSTDNRSQVVHTAEGKLVVTTIPYAPGEGNEELWLRAQLLRSEHRCPWVVLHHDPPLGSAVGGSVGNASLRGKIADYRPDYVFSGHLHHQPYEGSFSERVGKTWCFNPGFAKKASSGRPIPNHVVLDIREGVASWCATWEGDSSPRIQFKPLGEPGCLGRASCSQRSSS